MKKLLLCFLFLFPVFVFSQDRTSEVTSLVGSQMASLGYDSARAVRDFTMLIKVLKVQGIYFVSNGTKSSHYLYPQRTIYISLTDTSHSLLEKVLAELTHAIQFRFAPLYYSKAALASFGKTFLRMVFQPNKYEERIRELRRDSTCSKRNALIWASYGPEYTDPKSFEYDAHHVLEPRVHELFIAMNRLADPFTERELKRILQCLLP